MHGLAAQARCVACVDACPHEALLLDEDGLKIDTAVCTGCGHCLPACPRAAIGLAPPPVSHCDIRIDASALARCRQVAPGALPCQHALGLRDLEALARDGVRRLVLAVGDCVRCPDAPRGAGLGGALALHRSLRASRGLPALTVETGPAAPAAPVAVDRSRRRLFAALLGERPRPAAAQTPLAAHAPVIDGAACTGCDACARLCPDHAIVIEAAPQAAYRLVPDHCTGCGLCVDVCASGAITLAGPAPAVDALVALHRRPCSGCGAPFAWPVARSSEAPPLCPICQHRPPSRTLFQVIRAP